MEIKQIEKIAKAYKKIEILHKDIITLNKLAETVLKSERGLSLNMSIDKIKEQKKNDILDSDGSLKNVNIIREHINSLYTFSFSDCTNSKIDNSKINMNLDLDDLLSLEVIGVLISKKDKELKKLLNSIK